MRDASEQSSSGIFVSRTSPGPVGTVILDFTDVWGGRESVDVLKEATATFPPPRRIVAALGALDLSGESDYDSLDATAALIVRLNVAQVFAVGNDARSLYLAVGREGSWDGESQHCVDIDTAYDEVRAYVRPGDVVLVMGGASGFLRPLADRLRGELT